jgi:hypothetical protein
MQRLHDFLQSIGITKVNSILWLFTQIRAPIPTPKSGTACMCNHHLKIMILDGKK